VWLNGSISLWEGLTGNWDTNTAHIPESRPTETVGHTMESRGTPRRIGYVATTVLTLPYNRTSRREHPYKEGTDRQIN
jgi:hypothetical protein